MFGKNCFSFHMYGDLVRLFFFFFFFLYCRICYSPLNIRKEICF